MTSGRLLILDDEILTGQTIRNIAEFAGMEVRITTDADDFFATLRAWQPDFIALDLIMPGMDGVEVISRLAEEQCRARLIITSGVGSRVLDAAARSAAEHGLNFAGVLAKPFSPSALRELLAVPAPSDAPRPTRGRAPHDQAPVLGRDDLVRALESEELFVVYQPKVRCNNGTLAGFEALVRWNHPEQGFIPPDRFIVLAEQWDLIDPLTEHVFDHAVGWLTAFKRQAGEHASETTFLHSLDALTLSINISARSLTNFNLFDKLVERCDSAGLPRDRVIFEITETSAMADPVISLDILTRLRMKGFQLSIDDFGTGYSSMVQLVRLPFSEIKIDKSFVINAMQSDEPRSVVRSIVDLGRSLGLRTTAEGVEDRATLDYLRGVGCNLAQGYYLSRPIPSHEVTEWVQKHEQSREAQRLQALHALNVLDTKREQRFDRITALASELLDMPISLVTLVDAERQWFKSRHGFDATETPRWVSFCSHAIQNEQSLVISDALSDPRFQDNPLVKGDPNIRFYAGCPIRTGDGHAIGTLCVIDSAPRRFSDRDAALLTALAGLAEKELLEDTQAVSDELTGCLTRDAFLSRGRDLLALCAQLEQDAVLVLIKLLDLRRVNESAGKAAGNRLLADLGALLGRRFGTRDLLGRLGGDEFAILAIGQDRPEVKSIVKDLRSGTLASDRAGDTDPDAALAVGIGWSGRGAPKSLHALLADAQAHLARDLFEAHRNRGR